MVIALVLASMALVALATVVLYPWRVDAKLKLVTNASAISLAGGAEVAGLSASAAAILDGPGVLAIHLRGRELWRRSITRLSVDALFDWLETRVSKPPPKTKKSSLLSRMDVSELPELGLRILLGLRAPSFNGAVTCGFSDPALTGKAAAWLFPIAGVLAPFGVLDVSFDWSGRNRVDGEVDVSFRVVPARVAALGLRFAWHHVHLRAAPARLSAPTSTSLTTAERQT